MEKTSVENGQKEQKYLGNKGLIALIALLSAFIPLSTDIYLPALPSMAGSLNASEGLISLTLILFFIFYAAGTVFWGPLSDKYGRKRILLTGLSGYTVASVLCAVSGNVYQLIAFRILQAVASGSAAAVATAIVKDVYSGRRREGVLAIVQSMTMISPIIAPVLGAFILGFTTWRGVFFILAAIGVAAVAATVAFQETAVQLYKGGILKSLGRLGVVARNPGFIALLATFSIMAIPSMAFISASSYIYIGTFGLSEQTYSYYFAANALFSVMGPMVYMKISKHFKRGSIITASYSTAIVSGLLICTIGGMRPWLFALSIIPATLAGSAIRPPCTNLMLEQQQQDAGAVSSLMGCAFTLMGSIGMALISLNWQNKIAMMGIGYIIVALTSLILWTVVSKKPFVRQVSNVPYEQM
ncbi:DHA1 family bicyclomycin/chloramphenicol resistance-like MFS transporter [Anaerobacterium chartisolvens]|uniref:Bcr/CflA family efflux transporter n=1 Tax=Anaerobacterium chartisolvens TaxID=1297424 RepID=A0A369AJR8_9FIRM|nr:Bcr/CflA family efflux MFS transporter [Anaerobacterium chartisolvens]RCX09333.1 DHA1 family bicyclomycin/chloramphenicol resistance-like MFS transporter [Anaerobacterium chartisolvens]